VKSGLTGRDFRSGAKRQPVRPDAGATHHFFRCKPRPIAAKFTDEADGPGGHPENVGSMRLVSGRDDRFLRDRKQACSKT
jgi:hypothetical protein